MKKNSRINHCLIKSLNNKIAKLYLKPTKLMIKLQSMIKNKLNKKEIKIIKAIKKIKNKLKRILEIKTNP